MPARFLKHQKQEDTPQKTSFLLQVHPPPRCQALTKASLERLTLSRLSAPLTPVSAPLVALAFGLEPCSQGL